jgi:hypothetical protein
MFRTASGKECGEPVRTVARRKINAMAMFHVSVVLVRASYASWASLPVPQ